MLIVSVIAVYKWERKREGENEYNNINIAKSDVLFVQVGVPFIFSLFECLFSWITCIINIVFAGMLLNL